MTRPVLPDDHLPHPEAWTCRSSSTARRPKALAFPTRSRWLPARDTEAHFEVLRQTESYKPEELFDENGAVKPEVTAFMPTGELRIGANPDTNGGVIREELNLPALETTRSRKSPSTATAEASSKPPVIWASTLATSSRTTRTPSHRRTGRDRFQPVCRPLDVTNKQWDAGYLSSQVDEHMCHRPGH